MATFLELCQSVGKDSGLISRQNIPATVDSAQGKWGDIVDFTAQAYKRVQAGRSDWEFLRAEYSGSTVAGQSSYTPAQLGISSRFRFFLPDVLADGIQPHRLYDPAIGEADSQNLYQISPECWSMVYGRGSQVQTRPTEYALAAGKLYLGAIPDKVYTVKGAYMKAAQVLAEDDDEPELPEHFHDIIKWRAMMMVAGKDGAFVDRMVAQAEYTGLYRLLAAEQTRPMNMGGPIA